MTKRIVVALLVALSTITQVAAQSTGVTVKVTSAEDGEPIIGASVKIQDTSMGGVTDANGTLHLQKLPVEAKKLVISYLGMKPQTVTVKGGTVNVTLYPDVNDINEVVVTAMGISRQKKALGYATQEISSDQLTVGKDNNIINSLSGKLAGVRITNTQGDVGSSRIVIRGETSIAGENQPLFIVDGIPVDNSQLNGKGVGRDFKNAIADLNPEDIESMSVLKGPNASALYGARAAHGAIIITTKSGKGTKGLGVTGHVSTQVSFASTLPEFQNLFGQGAGGRFSYVDGKGAGVNDGVDESWGPRLDIGLNIPQFDSPLDADGNRTATPWVSHASNVSDFFRTGFTAKKGQTHESKATKGFGRRETRGHHIEFEHLEGERNSGYRDEFHSHGEHKLGRSMRSGQCPARQNIRLEKPDSQRSKVKRHHEGAQKQFACMFHQSCFISVRLIIARPRVTSSVYSSSSPTDMPRAITLTFTPVWASLRDIKKLVVSPSIVGESARITSFTSPLATRSTSESMVRSAGPMPSMGEIMPPSTW